MSGAVDVPADPLLSTPGVAQRGPLRPLLLGAVGALALAAAWLGGQLAVFAYLSPPALSASVEHTSGRAQLDTPLELHLRGAGTRLGDVRLLRAEGPVAVEPRPRDDNAWTLTSPDGGPLLRPDGDYRLLVSTLEPRPALPLPRTEVVDHEYRFSTVLAPHADVPGGQVKTPWGKPFSVTWSLPMARLSASVSPNVALQTSIDPQDAHRTWFQIGGQDGSGLTAGQTYTVTINAAQSADGVDLQQPVSFTVGTPLRPRLVDLPGSPVVLHYGDDLELTASTDLASVDVQASDGVAVETHLDGTRIVVHLPDFDQGMDFDLTVAAATSTEGAPLPKPVVLHVQTPAAFQPPTVRPGNGVTVPPTAHPTVTFSGAVADQAAALAAIHLDPPIAGSWRWTAPNRVELVPSKRLPVLTKYQVRIQGGPDGPRSAAGGFLANDVRSSFQTTHDKLIDVSLDKQQVTLIQDGAPIRTIAAATGVAAAPTPPGDYEVLYKMATARFTGTNPDGSHYDIPDVHWVLAFMGDYTIHGAYWRGRFGVPGSDGCVSMTDPDAKVVFDWADEGTPIHIHH
jgi:lipoprotein-anchoring transpeptidase ErfK/SrfK